MRVSTISSEKITRKVLKLHLFHVDIRVDNKIAARGIRTGEIIVHSMPGPDSAYWGEEALALWHENLHPSCGRPTFTRRWHHHISEIAATSFRSSVFRSEYLTQVWCSSLSFSLKIVRTPQARLINQMPWSLPYVSTVVSFFPLSCHTGWYHCW